jgi:hypothetical protein
MDFLILKKCLDDTVYVWLDALANYLTVAGYGTKDFTWPPTIQVIGKKLYSVVGPIWTNKFYILFTSDAFMLSSFNTSL